MEDRAAEQPRSHTLLRLGLAYKSQGTTLWRGHFWGSAAGGEKLLSSAYTAFKWATQIYRAGRSVKDRLRKGRHEYCTSPVGGH